MRINTLDIILCSGNSFLSNKIKWLQGLKKVPYPDNQITHAAFILELADQAAVACGSEIDFNGLYVCETTTLNKWADKKGLQVNPFSKWLTNYAGKVYIKHLHNTLWYRNSKQNLRSWVCKHLKDKDAKRYESGIPGLLELILCEFGMSKHILKTDQLHCTEWVGETLMEFGILQKTVSPNRMPPHVWWREIDILLTTTSHIERVK
jgi:hypothetical protein